MAADQAPEAGPPSDREPGPSEGGPGLAGARPGRPDAEADAEALAELGQRLLARIVDTLVVGLPTVMVVRALVPQNDADVVAPPAVAVFLLLYEWIQLTLWGRTVGKRFAGIEVVRRAPALNVSGGIDATPEDIEASTEVDRAPAPSLGAPGRLGTVRSLARVALYALPIGLRSIPVFGVIAGLFWVGNVVLMFEGARRETLHDRLAGTTVVKRRPL